MQSIRLVYILNFVGIIAFAISGSIKGIKHSLDLLGIVVLGVVTALGGGILRDLLLNTLPSVLLNEWELFVAVIASLIPFFFAKKISKIAFFIKIFDALGLAVFTVTGAEKGFSFNLGMFGVIIMGTSTGVAGGMIRDIMVSEIPFVLKEEIYASFSIVGSFLFFLMARYTMIPRTIIIYTLITLIFLGRLIAIKYKLSLPKSRE